MVKTNIKLLNLKSEINEIKEEIQKSFEKIIYTNTNFILGEELLTFEKNFSKYINTNYCIGVGNGTDALEIAINSLNLKEDDEIITQANTFISTCLGITNNKNKIKLVDINPDTYQLDLDLLEKSITPKTKVVLIVHLTGSCCNMDKLMNIINKHNLILIEDCAQSHGAYFKNKRLGTFGLLSTFSFYPGKNLGAFGDGGAICTNDKNLFNKILKIRNIGSIEKYKHELIGRNSRLDTLQASVLDIKLKRLDINNEKRRKNAELYCQLLQNINELELPLIEKECIPVYHLFIIRCKKRDELREYLKNENIETGIHYPCSIPELTCYENQFNKNLFKNSIQNSKKILSLPMYPNLPEEHIKLVCKRIISFYSSL
jgi:dTDP-4-amino-4,6-dideoxygalactose transaminase